MNKIHQDGGMIGKGRPDNIEAATTPRLSMAPSNALLLALHTLRSAVALIRCTL
jgi:hypothetical protein